MKNSISISLILIILLISCTVKNPNTRYEAEIVHGLNNLESEYEAICKQAGMEVWEYYSDPGKKSMTKYKERFSGFFMNDSTIRNINDWNSKISEISNDTLIRRLELWKSIITCAQVDFNPEIIDLQNILEAQLSNYPSDDISDDELEKSIINLIRLRNDKSKDLGYGNYAYMVLQNTGNDTIWFENLILRIDSASCGKQSAYLRQ